MSIEIIFGQFCWPSYLTSNLTSISVNLIMSIYFFLWTSSIVCMFDFLIFDIFLTTWHLFDILTHQLNLNHLSPHRAIFSLSNHVLGVGYVQDYTWDIWLFCSIVVDIPRVNMIAFKLRGLSNNTIFKTKDASSLRNITLFACVWSHISWRNNIIRINKNV